MAEKFKLQLGLIALVIAISKSNDSKTGFKQGIDGKLVKTIRILPKHDPVSSVNDIERVVNYSELKSYYPLDDKLIEIDAKAIKRSVTTNSDTMMVLKIVPADQILPYQLNGSHSFVEIQKGEKSKKISVSDQKLYTMIREVLQQGNQVLLVAFTSRNIEKYGIIYASPAGLHLSQLINSNLLRKDKQNNIVAITEDEVDMISTKIMKGLIADYHQSDTHDQFSDKLEEAIIAKIKGIPFELPPEEEVEDSGMSALDMLKEL